ncbi:MAG: amino acid ABC transporter permease [Coxiellaceae bacterium]|jgi:polar amino acid transport system permease protein|nr:amino acid ABC transporter permease [Coxiellaceae bacterium]
MLTTFFVQLMPGLKVTLGLFILTLLFSIPLGIILAIGRVSSFRMLAPVISFYIWVMRGTPLMLQLIFFYFGAMHLGLNCGRFFASVVVFVLNYAAYFAEIFRAGIQAIDKSQYEGADVLGLNFWQTIYFIVLPQAIKKILPPLSNEVINLIKDTTLAQSIGVVEMFATLKVTVIRDFVIYPFIVAAGFYLVFTQLITKLFARLEKYYAYYE